MNTLAGVSTDLPGNTDNLRHNQGTQLLWLKATSNGSRSRLFCRPGEIEGLKALRVRERYPGRLCKRFLKLQNTCQVPPADLEVPERQRDSGRPHKNPRKITGAVNVDDKFLLATSDMTVHTTYGPIGICPILLVFGQCRSFHFRAQVQPQCHRLSV